MYQEFIKNLKEKMKDYFYFFTNIDNWNYLPDISIKSYNSTIAIDQTDHLYIICNKCGHPQSVKTRSTKHADQADTIHILTRCIECPKSTWQNYRKIMSEKKLNRKDPKTPRAPKKIQ